MWNFMPFGLLAGHSATWTEICAVLAAIAICGVIALVVSLILAARGDSFLPAAISFGFTAVAALSGWLIWALALSTAATHRAQLAFQQAFVLLVCRHLLLVVALAFIIWGAGVIVEIVTTDYQRDRYSSRTHDTVVVILCLLAATGVLVGALAFSY